MTIFIGANVEGVIDKAIKLDLLTTTTIIQSTNKEFSSTARHYKTKVEVEKAYKRKMW